MAKCLSEVIEIVFKYGEPDKVLCAFNRILIGFYNLRDHLDMILGCVSENDVYPKTCIF